MAGSSFEPLKKPVETISVIHVEISLEWPLPASVSAWWRARNYLMCIYGGPTLYTSSLKFGNGKCNGFFKIPDF